MGGRLVGRGAEIRAVRERLAHGGAVAVVGAAGVGKTSLVHAAVEGHDHVIGGGLSMLTDRPYSALEQAVRRRLAGDPVTVAEQVHAMLGGAVLVVEDVQWVHPATLRALAVLGERLPLVVSSRPDGRDLLEAVVPRCDWIELGPLGRRPAERLARSLHPDRSDTDLRSLLAVAGGVPLLLHRMGEPGGRVSASVRDAIVHRLGELDDPARRAVGALALLGRPGRADEVGACGALAPDLVEATDDGRLRFRHDAFAAGAVAMLDDVERRALHAGLASRLHDDAEAAPHAYAAGELVSTARRAARAARTARQHGDRAELFRLAADATAQLGPGAPSVEASHADSADALRARAVEAFVHAGRWHDAIAQARLIGDEDPATSADAARQRGRAEWLAGDVVEARRQYRRAETLASEVGDQVRAVRAANERAYLEVRDRVPGYADVARGAVERARAAGTGEARAQVTLGLAQLQDDDAAWETTLRDVLPVARATGDDELEAVAAYHLVSGLGARGRFVEAVELGHEHMVRARELGMESLAAQFEQAWIFQRALIGGDAAAVVDAAAEHFRRGGATRNRDQILHSRAVAELDLGRIADARATVDHMAAISTGTPEEQVKLAAARSELAWHTADVGLARAALDAARSAGDAFFGLRLLVERTVAHTLVAAGLAIDPRPATSPLSVWTVAEREIGGLVAMASGEHRWAAVELQRAADRFEEMGIVRWAVRAGMAATAAAAEAGARTVATRRSRYVDLARRAGAVGTLRRLGYASRPELTFTEETVLLRIAQGATSREVAAEMGIAPGTVDQHVESARRKLGASTRIEAALLLG